MQLLFILRQNEWKCLVLQVLVKLSVLLLVFCCGIISFHNRLTTGITRRIEVHLKFCYFFCCVRVIHCVRVITPVLPFFGALVMFLSKLLNVDTFDDLVTLTSIHFPATTLNPVSVNPISELSFKISLVSKSEFKGRVRRYSRSQSNKQIY